MPLSLKDFENMRLTFLKPASLLCVIAFCDMTCHVLFHRLLENIVMQKTFYFFDHHLNRVIELANCGNTLSVYLSTQRKYVFSFALLRVKPRGARKQWKHSISRRPLM